MFSVFYLLLSLMLLLLFPMCHQFLVHRCLTPHSPLGSVGSDKFTVKSLELSHIPLQQYMYSVLRTPWHCLFVMLIQLFGFSNSLALSPCDNTSWLWCTFPLSTGIFEYDLVLKFDKNGTQNVSNSNFTTGILSAVSWDN